MCFTLTFHLCFIFGYNLLVFSEFRRRRHDVSALKNALVPKKAITTTRLFPASRWGISNKLLEVQCSREDGGKQEQKKKGLFHVDARAPRIMSCKRAQLPQCSQCARDRDRNPEHTFITLLNAQDNDDDDDDPKVSSLPTSAKGFCARASFFRSPFSAPHALLKAQGWGCIRKTAGLGLNSPLWWAQHCNLQQTSETYIQHNAAMCSI